MSVHRLKTNPIHLGTGASAVVQPPFTGMEWYAHYGARHGGDGVEGRLVSMHTFTEAWDTWEVHPEGHEVVLCTSGCLRLIQESKGETLTVTLQPGEYAINEPGVWHTADVVEGPVTAVFITAGLGTDHRPR
ncbi:MAG: cupin [Myxococcota bacterium]